MKLQTMKYLFSGKKKVGNEYMSSVSSVGNSTKSTLSLLSNLSRKNTSSPHTVTSYPPPTKEELLMETVSARSPTGVVEPTSTVGQLHINRKSTPNATTGTASSFMKGKCNKTKSTKFPQQKYVYENFSNSPIVRDRIQTNPVETYIIILLLIFFFIVCYQ